MAVVDVDFPVLNPVSGGHRRSKVMRRSLVCGSLVVGLIAFVLPALRAAQIPGLKTSVPNLTPPVANELPVPKPGGIVQGAVIKFPNASGGSSSSPGLVVEQSDPKAIIDWSSFNIGRDAWTHFDQQGHANWMALNRIYDRNPSQIFGKLTADGKIYLVNQNGILFGPSSKVNVSSLTASALNIKDDDFLAGRLNFKKENYQERSDWDAITLFVANRGVITTEKAGSVFLIADNVENQGLIESPFGQIGLAAGTEVSIYSDSSQDLGLRVKVTDTPGNAWNLESGALVADSGLIGMYGAIVEQDGLAKSMVTVKRTGMIELLAAEKIITGKNSLTTCIVTDSNELVHSSFEFEGGRIVMSGLVPSSTEGVGTIEHYGVLYAPSGNIKLYAKDRAFFESGSLISVAGNWTKKPLGANTLDVQLNSVELSDDYGQKTGNLKGETLTIYGLTGSAIGNVSGYLKNEQQTAREKSTFGGDILVNVTSGDIIIKDGAVFDFSGGGIKYGNGILDTTKLLSGNTLYDIADAPQWLQYDKIIDGKHTAGEGKYYGVSHGGANPLGNYSSGYVQGDDAGSLTLVGKQVVLDGTLNGSATRGYYQRLAEDAVDSNGDLLARGLRMPDGGSLTLGVLSGVKGDYHYLDNILESVVIQKEVASLGATFSASDQLPQTVDGGCTTYLSSDKLSSSGLSHLNIGVNLGVRIEEGAKLSLLRGGSFEVNSRRIEHYGEISIAGGDVLFTLADNVTTDPEIELKENLRFVDLDERIYLASGSKISVQGEKVDNSLVGKTGKASLAFGLKDGGEVSLYDYTTTGDGVIVRPSAVIDVSGGYQINSKGKVSGGDAGALKIAGQAISLEGDLRGYSLLGSEGGAISLLAKNVTIANNPILLPEDFGAGSSLEGGYRENMTLGGDYLQPTGFTDIKIQSFYDVNFEQGVTLAPSLVKMADPTPACSVSSLKNQNSMTASGSAGLDIAAGLVTVSSELLGSSSIKIGAGVGMVKQADEDSKHLNAMIVLSENSGIEVAPGGELTLSAPGIEIAGLLQARAGDISVTASRNDLTLKSGSHLDARGINILGDEIGVKGMGRAVEALSGGDVSLSAKLGNLVIESQALIDVSGSATTQSPIVKSNGKVSTITVASSPGSIDLAYYSDLTLNGDLLSVKSLDTLKGGALSISRIDPTGRLAASGEELNRYTQAGFDDLTLRSYGTLELAGAMECEIGRKLTLDAPLLVGSTTGEEGGLISLDAPWLRLINTYYNSDGRVAAEGNAGLLLSGGWIDVEGDIVLSGFRNVAFDAQRDLRFADAAYSLEATSRWSGRLATSGSLELEANRIYPTTQSIFTILAGGKVTTAGNGNPSKAGIYSAGGEIAIQAPDIEHKGYLAAPLGRITLDAGADGRVLLAAGSTLTTKGSILPVKYGEVSDSFWTISDKSQADITASASVKEAPEKSILVEADEAIVMDGAVLDFSGGGSVFAYEFLPGVEGTANPLGRSDRYVIVPDHSLTLPGESITVTKGNKYLPAGTYALLSVKEHGECAFLPGAIIVTRVSDGALKNGSVSTEGYPLVEGYTGVLETSFSSQAPEVFSVRRAGAVLKEGHFDVRNMFAGSAGSLSVQGNTTILSGLISGAPLRKYTGGVISLSGVDVEIGAATAGLDDDFRWDSAVPEELRGKLNVSADLFEDKKLEAIEIGALDRTESITMLAGSVLDARQITLNAAESIVLDPETEIRATGEEGSVSLITDNGRISVAQGAIVKASDLLSLDARELELLGKIKLDEGSLHLSSNEIFVVPEGYSGDTTGALYITEAMWERFGSLAEVSLKSRSDLTFLGDVDLSLNNGALTLDAARIAGFDANDNVSIVNIAAESLQLLNSGSIAGAGGFSDTGEITLTAREITLGHGDLTIDGFGEIGVNAEKGVTFSGSGSLIAQGNLSLRSAWLAASYYKDGTGKYEVSNFTVDAGSNSIDVRGADGSQNTATSIPGGTLEFIGRQIHFAGQLDMPSGRLGLSATGDGADDGVFIESGAQILAQSSDYASGGIVSLSSESGNIVLDTGALIDVSAAHEKENADAGGISIQAAAGGVFLNGSILGAAGEGGLGGSFEIDTLSLASFGELNQRLANGGFDNALSFRLRTGDLLIDESVKAHEVALTADTGGIQLGGNGVIDVSGEDKGGRVELNAGEDIILASGAKIYAQATGTDGLGGEVVLSSKISIDGENSGWIKLAADSLIDVTGAGGGGEVYLRAQRLDSSVNAELNGTMVGASRIVLEAAKAYDLEGAQLTGIWSQIGDAESFMANAASIKDLLLANATLDAGAFHLLPGIEIRTEGDLTVSSALSLTDSRFGEEAGVLTLRSGGNLTIKQDIVDSNSLGETWGLNLIAGADLESADLMAAKPGVGDLSIASQATVHTTNASIQFASGNNTTFSTASTAGDYKNGLPYNLGTHSGSITGQVGGDLSLNGGIIQSATGDIDIEVGGDLILASSSTGIGSIRTTGIPLQVELPDELPTSWEELSYLPNTGTMGAVIEFLLNELPAEAEANGMTAQEFYDLFRAEGFDRQLTDIVKAYYWLYHDGGDINLRVKGDVNPNKAYANNAWDFSNEENSSYGISYHLWSASYDGNNATQGIATMGGGSVAIDAGGNVFLQAGSFGEGNLRIHAAGDIAGRFLVKNGSAEIHAMGNFGDPTKAARTVIEAFDSQINVSAQGDINLGSVVNPTVVREGFGSAQQPAYSSLSYSEKAAVSLVSSAGSISIYGHSDFHNAMEANEVVFPATLRASAAEDIILYETIALAPSADGNLSLKAGGDILGVSASKSGVIMSDLAPEVVYGSMTDQGAYRKLIYANKDSDGNVTTWSVYSPDLMQLGAHGYPSEYLAAYEKMQADLELLDPISREYFITHDLLSRVGVPLHRNDDAPAEVTAGGDIKNLSFFLPKKADIAASRDIVDINLISQNVHEYDTTSVIAGRNLKFKTEPVLVKTTGLDDTGITHAGPGLLFVSAGNSVDLGSSVGILTVGNLYNTSLDAEGSSLIVASGYKKNMTSESVQTFFKELRELGESYSAAQQKGEADEARSFIEEARETVIEPFLGDGEIGEGDIDMVRSQISTLYGGDISILAAGDINVGVTTFSDDTGKDTGTGINTQAGGDLNIYAEGDVNVNESRVMTWLGGDIAIWSNYGSINAGRGSKTEVNTSKPRLVLVNGVWQLQRKPAAVGSGLRSMSYDPDGPEGPVEKPEPGDIYVFAPEGVIDAGEAGIASEGRIILGATQVLNVQNISAVSGSVGMPTTGESGIAMGALAGVSNMSEQNAALQNVAGLGETKDQLAKQEGLGEQTIAWLDVKVIGYDAESGEDEEKKQ